MATIISIYMLMQSINSAYEKVFFRDLPVASWNEKGILSLDAVEMY